MEEFFDVLFYLILCSIWGYRIYEGVKEKSKFEIIYSSIVIGIFTIVVILKMVKILIG